MLPYWAKFGFWSIVSRKIKMLEKNAFLQQLLVSMYQKADRRCHIAREFVIFAMVHLFRIKSLLRFKHCLIPKIKTKWPQWPHHSSGWFRQLRKQKGAMLAKKSVLAIKYRSVALFILHDYVISWVRVGRHIYLCFHNQVWARRSSSSYLQQFLNPLSMGTLNSI